MPRLLIGSFCGLAIAGGAISLASANSAPPTTPVVYQTAVQPGVQPAASTTVQALAAGLTAFERAPSGTDQPPPDIIDHDVLLRGGNPNLARLATTVNGQSVYLVPADGGVCLVSSTFLAGGCFTIADAVTGLHMEKIVCSPFLASNEFEVFGLAANDVSGLSLTFSDGSQKALATNGNVFVVDAPKAGPYPTGISWNEASGNHSQPLFTSADAAPACGGPGPSIAIAVQRAAIGAAANAQWGPTAGTAATQAARAAILANGGQVAH